MKKLLLFLLFTLPAFAQTPVLQQGTAGGVTFYQTATSAGSSTQLTFAAPTLTIGLAGTSSGILALTGATSGQATLTAPAVAGVATNPVVSSNSISFPANNGIVQSSNSAIGLFLGNVDGSLASFKDTTASYFYLNRSFALAPSAMVIGWTNSTNAGGTQDTGISRLAAASFAFGNAVQGDFSGTIKETIDNAVTGFQINGAATSTNYLRGNGTNFVSSAIQAGDLPSAIPIANVGSAGLSGTAPISIASTGVISITSPLPIANGGTGAATVAAGTVFGNPTGSTAAPSFTTAPVVTSIGTGTPPTCTAGTGGVFCAGEGTAPTAASAVGQLYADSTLHDLAVQANGGGKGIVWHSAPGQIRSTGLVAAVSTATLCAATAGACIQAGHYTVQWTFYESGTACGTPGTGGVTFLLTWTDGNGTAHSAISLPMDDATSLVATSGTFHFQSALATAWASGNFNIDTNGSIIQYATGYTGCGVGTGTYALSATVTRMQ